MQSKTQIDLLGERLKKGLRTEEDLRLLDTYRRTFHVPYDKVTRIVREELGLDPTGRPAKSTSSVIDKLMRESIRLSQIQDIAGCRVVISNLLEQKPVVQSLKKIYSEARYVDRLKDPKYGYRAIHIIPIVDRKPIEIQVRSLLQHLWAELSEKISDKFGKDLKYGGGNKEWLACLFLLSDIIERYEGLQSESIATRKKLDILNNKDNNTQMEHCDEIDAFYDELLKAIDIINDTIDSMES